MHKIRGNATVVVTGGAGFIGAHLVRALLRSGTAGHVTVLDDLSTGHTRSLDGVDGVDLVVGNVVNADLTSLFADADAVVHLAALVSVPASMRHPVEANEVNATGTLRVLEAARRAGGIYTVVASSAALYGTQRTRAHHEGLPPAPASPQASSKLAAEAHTATYLRAFGLPSLSLRLFNVYGPGQSIDAAHTAVIPAFVSAAVRARPASLHGDGQQTRDFVHVATVAEVLRRAVATHVASPDPVNVASGQATSLNEVLAMLEVIVGHPIELLHGPSRPGDIRHSCGDIRRLHDVFPGLRTVSLPDGLRDTVAWVRRTRGASDGVGPAPATPWTADLPSFGWDPVSTPANGGLVRR